MSAEPLEVTCPLCGTRFSGSAACAAGCPLARHCATLCCPNCHYRFVEESSLTRWLARLWARRRR